MDPSHRGLDRLAGGAVLASAQSEQSPLHGDFGAPALVTQALRQFFQRLQIAGLCLTVAQQVAGRLTSAQQAVAGGPFALGRQFQRPGEEAHRFGVGIFGGRLFSGLPVPARRQLILPGTVVVFGDQGGVLTRAAGSLADGLEPAGRPGVICPPVRLEQALIGYIP